jgi:hypothetical protein
MDFPADIIPTTRQFEAGDWPSKSYRSINGVEVRLLYGSEQTGMKLALGYQNISDSDAERFLDHYKSRNGTFLTFRLPLQAGTRAGWQGNEAALSAGSNSWRYEGPPQLTNKRPGYSDVSVTLVAVL